MIHELRLDSEPFYNIQRGIKKVEARLLDEKRQKIKIGDTIVFIHREQPDQEIRAIVTHLFFFKSFNEMFTSLHKKYRSRYILEELIDSMLIYYSAEEEKKYGVVGIEIALIS